jgi:hypothetical protein
LRWIESPVLFFDNSQKKERDVRQITLAKGLFRFGFAPSINKGTWYLGVVCRRCGKPILRFEDPTKGSGQISIDGPGKLSMPCDDCLADDVYESKDLRAIQAEESRPSFREKRPPATGGTRQPLRALPQYKDAIPIFGVGAIEHRPVAAQIVARCITYWTVVEASSADLLAVMLKANTEPAIALYLSLQNARAKTDALQAIATTTLEAEDLKLALALLAHKTAVEKRRNDLAHGVFGFSNTIPDGLLWITTTDYSHYNARRMGIEMTDELTGWLEDHIYVYEIGALETVARKIETLEKIVTGVVGYLRLTDPAARVSKFAELSAALKLA